MGIIIAVAASVGITYAFDLTMAQAIVVGCLCGIAGPLAWGAISQ